MGDLKYNLNKLGLHWFEVDAEIDLAELIIEIIKSRNIRFIKAIPFLIWQNLAGNLSSLSLEKLHKLSAKNELRLETAFILKIASKIFEKEKNSFNRELNAIIGLMLPKEKLLLLGKENNLFLSFLNFKISSFSDFFEESYQEFRTQKKLSELEQKELLQEKIIKSKELNLRFALSRLFKPKQREIISNILENKPLTKTEYEYYVRIIKKKLEAIRQLNELSEAVLQRKALKE